MQCENSFDKHETTERTWHFQNISLIFQNYLYIFTTILKPDHQKFLLSKQFFRLNINSMFNVSTEGLHNFLIFTVFVIRREHLSSHIIIMENESHKPSSTMYIFIISLWNWCDMENGNTGYTRMLNIKGNGEKYYSKQQQQIKQLVSWILWFSLCTLQISRSRICEDNARNEKRNRWVLYIRLRWY